MEAAANNTFVMDDPDPRFADSCIGVAATEFERATLKQQYKGRIEWVDDDSPLIADIGNLGEVPLRYRFYWAKLGGKRVLFYECAGEFDARPFIQRWLGGFGICQLTNALMFHNVIMTVTDGRGLER